MLIQLYGVAVTLVWSGGITFVLLKLVGVFVPLRGVAAAGAGRPRHLAARRSAAIGRPPRYRFLALTAGQDCVPVRRASRFEQACLCFGRDGMAQERAIPATREKGRIHSPLGNDADLARHLIHWVLAVPA